MLRITRIPRAASKAAALPTAKGLSGPRLAHAIRNQARACIAKASPDSLDVPGALALLGEAREASLKHDNVVRIPSDTAPYTTVCGDVHGQGPDFLSIFERFGEPAVSRPYLFNGDLVDRGPFGAEIALTLAALMVERPGSIYVNRGNHEVCELYREYGFAREVQRKYGEKGDAMELAFRHFFNALPIAHIVDDRIFVVHGGLPKKRDATAAEINELARDADDPPNMIYQMLWSDPIPDGIGRGAAFRAEDTKTFLKANGCEFLIRSHEVKDPGYELHHDGLCATVFSAPKYCNHYDNKGAVAKIVHGAKGKRPEFVQFGPASEMPAKQREAMLSRVDSFQGDGDTDQQRAAATLKRKPKERKPSSKGKDPTAKPKATRTVAKEKPGPARRCKATV